jgi:transposase
VDTDLGIKTGQHVPMSKALRNEAENTFGKIQHVTRIQTSAAIVHVIILFCMLHMSQIITDQQWALSFCMASLNYYC